MGVGIIIAFNTPTNYVSTLTFAMRTFLTDPFVRRERFLIRIDIFTSHYTTTTTDVTHDNQWRVINSALAVGKL